MRPLATLAGVLLLSAAPHVQTPAAPPTFHLLFIGHDVGGETDTARRDARGTTVDCVFHLVDRATTLDLTGSVSVLADGEPARLRVEGRNYRLFRSDSEVTIANGRAHVRDLGAERDVETGGRPFFPIDNYAPVGVQEALIQYWLARGRPAAIAAAPSGPVVRIAARGETTIPGDRGGPARHLERLSIDGVVWGTETAWIDPARRQLVAVATWMGALPFEAIRDGWQDHRDQLIAEGVTDRIEDLTRLTRGVPVKASGVFALVGARVVGGTARPPIEDATVVVRDGRIAAVGPSKTTSVPADAVRVDVAGKTITAGLWDSHAHASQVDWAPVYLASGVTTIRDMGGEEPFLVAARDAIASGAALGPRYLLAGLIDGPGPKAFGMVTASTPDEARAIVRRYHDERFEQIKVYQIVPPALVPVMASEAHRLGLLVTGHVPDGMTWRSVVEAGYDSIAHMQLRGQPGSEATAAQIAFFKAHHTAMDPTLSWNELAGRSMARPLDSLLPGVSRLPAPLARMFASMDGGAGRPQTNALRLIKEAVDAGLLVMAGTDKGVPGFSLQRELELYVEGGLTPLEAIQTATIMPARAMGLDAELGTVEPGKIADLVVFDANPLDGIANVRTAQLVVSNGRLYDCDDLWRAAGYAPRGR